MNIKIFEIIECGYRGLAAHGVDGESQPNNGAGREYAAYLIIKHKGKILSVESDAMEPEDVRFYRDLSWVKDMIEQAYELGAKDNAQ